MKRAIFIGRWSPFHNGHLAIMQKKIDEGVPLLVMVRDTPYDLYPPMLRKRQIEAAMQKMNVDAKVMIIDDMESINYGRGVGYGVNAIEVPEEIKKISATEIRSKIQSGDTTWREWVPKGADTVLENYLKENGLVVWFTGLSKSGKVEIAKIVSSKLEDAGVKSERMDGTILRKNISQDLGYEKEDRDKNINRAVYISKLLTRNGGVVLSSFVTPFNSEQASVREELSKNGQFVEIFVKSSIEKCKERNPEFYNAGHKDIAGVDAPYEEPKNPEVTVDSDNNSMEECADKVVEYLLKVL